MCNEVDAFAFLCFLSVVLLLLALLLLLLFICNKIKLLPLLVGHVISIEFFGTCS